MWILILLGEWQGKLPWRKGGIKLNIPWFHCIMVRTMLDLGTVSKSLLARICEANHYRWFWPTKIPKNFSKPIFLAWNDLDREISSANEHMHCRIYIHNQIEECTSTKIGPSSDLIENFERIRFKGRHDGFHSIIKFQFEYCTDGSQTRVRKTKRAKLVQLSRALKFRNPNRGKERDCCFGFSQLKKISFTKK